MSLTCTLAVHNEEQNIERCLKSVYTFVDEIVLVDGESTDHTVELAKKLDTKKKLKVISTPNKQNFHIMKQMANDAATSEWIFQIDADEAVSKDLAAEIQQIVETNSSEFDGYWIPRLNYFLGKPLRKGGQYPDKTLRLYRAKKGRLPCKSVHEQAEVKGEVSELTSDLLHYPYPTFSMYLEKWYRYALLEAQQDHADGIRPNMSTALEYFVTKPLYWFFKTYIRHRGYVDGFSGFVFSYFSGLRYVAEYVFLYEIDRTSKRTKK